MKDVEEDWAKTNDWLAQNPNLALVAIRSESGDEVEDTEETQSILIGRATLQRVAGAYHMYRNGLLDEELWQARLKTMDAYIFGSGSAFTSVWSAQTKLLFSDSFIELVEQRVLERDHEASKQTG